MFIYETTSVADPDPGSGAFLIPGSGMGKNNPNTGSGSGMNNRDYNFESLETIFGLKILFLNSWMRSGDGEKIQDSG
jgi:hypothetical protein